MDEQDSFGIEQPADSRVRRREQWMVILLVFLFFEVGYLWAGAGHSPVKAWHGAIGLDTQIPLVPFFIVFYMLGYVFVLSPAVLLRDRKDFHAGITVFVTMLSLAFLCFHFFPVFMQKQYATGSDFFSVLTRYQQKMDVPYNNLPSLHVALNLFAWLLIFYQSGRKALWWLPVPVCIVISTLLVKQHLLLDVAGGVVLALCGFAAWFGLRRINYVQYFYIATLLFVLVVLLLNIKGVLTGVTIALNLILAVIFPPS